MAIGTCTSNARSRSNFFWRGFAVATMLFVLAPLLLVPILQVLQVVPVSVVVVNGFCSHHQRHRYQHQKGGVGVGLTAESKPLLLSRRRRRRSVNDGGDGDDEEEIKIEKEKLNPKENTSTGTGRSNIGTIYYRRDRFFRTIASASVSASGLLTLLWPQQLLGGTANAFDGGVGGLGKTKPSTGVTLFDDTMKPIQNEKTGEISVEIKGCGTTGGDVRPILVSYRSPWPLLSSSGKSSLESRDIRSTESAFVQVVNTNTSSKRNKGDSDDRKKFQKILMESVFNSEGKFGAYGTPYDVQVKKRKRTKGNDNDGDESGYWYYTVNFTTLTPAMRESERTAVIGSKQVNDETLVLLVVTTLSTKFKSQEGAFDNILDSFQAVPAPETKLRK